MMVSKGKSDDKLDVSSMSITSDKSPNGVEPEVELELQWYRQTFYRVQLPVLLFMTFVDIIHFSIFGMIRSALISLGWSNFQSSALMAVTQMLSAVMSVTGGFISDVFLGRFRTVLIGATMYLIGSALLAVAMLPSIYNDVMYLCVVLVLTPMGGGFCKGLMASFGGDQFDKTTEKGKAELASFFAWAYMASSIGCGVAYGYLVTLGSSGQPGLVPLEWGYFVAHLVVAACAALAVLLFILPSRQYNCVPPTGSGATTLMKYLYASAFHPNQASMQGRLSFLSWILLIIAMIFNIVQSLTGLAWAAYVSLGAAMLSTGFFIGCHIRPTFIDKCEEQEGLTRIDAKNLLETFPILVSACVGFGLAYNNTVGLFFSLSCQMDVRMLGTQINGAGLVVIDCVLSLIFTPIVDKLVFPALNKFLGIEITPPQKLLMGMAIAVIGSLSAVGIEFWRRASDVLIDQPSYCAPEGVNMSDLSVWWMIIPYAFLGLASVFTFPPLLHFAYTQSPPAVRSLGFALTTLFAVALPQCFSASLSGVLQPLFTDDLNDGNLEVFFYIAAGVAAVTIPVLIYLQHIYVMKDHDDTAADEKERSEIGTEKEEEKV